MILARPRLVLKIDFEGCPHHCIPFDETGERIQRDGSWCAYEFAVQPDAIQFWDRFDRRWFRGEEFIYPDRPKGLPQLREPVDMYGLEGARSSDILIMQREMTAMAIHHVSPGEVFDLAPLSSNLKDARTTAIVKSEAFEVVRLVVHAGVDIKTHQVDGSITLHCLKGRTLLGLPETTTARKSRSLVSS